ncbi:potassium channel family protein [Nocardioides sp. J9]|uniref:potassium channel family protein n=1 Tax=Nocardioides sp. J9 TaxID=935844 RepID=UPI0037CC9AF8
MGARSSYAPSPSGSRLRRHALAHPLRHGTRALAVHDAEQDAPTTNITAFGDALWWAATTVATVGYGGRYPVTLEGRLWQADPARVEVGRRPHGRRNRRHRLDHSGRSGVARCKPGVSRDAGGRLRRDFRGRPAVDEEASLDTSSRNWRLLANSVTGNVSVL